MLSVIMEPLWKQNCMIWALTTCLVTGFCSAVALDDITKFLEEVDPDPKDVLYHYDKDHPINLTVQERNYTRMLVSWEMPKNMSETDLLNFVVFYYKRKERETSVHYNKTVEPDVFQLLIKGLQPGTKYSFYVLANYSSGHMPVSHALSILLPGYGDDTLCNCNIHGANDTICNPKTGQCHCWKGATGRQCDTCDKGFYWRDSAPWGCRPCPQCNPTRSNGTCSSQRINGISMPLCHCLGNYGGQTCDNCADSYFMERGRCVPCECNNNTRPDAAQVCTTKGKCVFCGYNTVGDHCEKCLEGYEGDALARNCTQIASSAKYYDVNGHRATVVGVSVALAIVAIILIAALIYKKCWQNRRKPLQFWTVELRDDHEQVNFSSMMEQPEYQNVDASLLENSRYYEKDSPRPTKNQLQDVDVVVETTTRNRSNPGPYQSLPGKPVQA